MFPYLYINTLFFAALFLIASKVRQDRICRGKYYNYTVLGDSIAFGLWASFNRGYVFLLRNYFRCKYSCVWLENEAIPGITSRAQLILLKESPSMRETVRKAHAITISIGGNNLLESTSENYTCINEKIACEGVNRFTQDWPLILECIRKDICSDARIYAMTIYNPYKCSDPNYIIANKYITQINSVIADPVLIAQYGYIVVDVYGCFERNMNKTWTGFNRPKRNPHPNNEGHKQIALLHAKAIKLNEADDEIQQQI